MKTPFCWQRIFCTWKVEILAKNKGSSSSSGLSQSKIHPHIFRKISVFRFAHSATDRVNPPSSRMLRSFTRSYRAKLVVENKRTSRVISSCGPSLPAPACFPNDHQAAACLRSKPRSPKCSDGQCGKLPPSSHLGPPASRCKSRVDVICLVFWEMFWNLGNVQLGIPRLPRGHC